MKEGDTISAIFNGESNEFVISSFQNYLISMADIRKSPQGEMVIMRITAPGIDRIGEQIKRFEGTITGLLPNI